MVSSVLLPEVMVEIMGMVVMGSRVAELLDAEADDPALEVEAPEASEVPEAEA